MTRSPWLIYPAVIVLSAADAVLEFQRDAVAAATRALLRLVAA
ncbi:hypothetical protein [Rhodococcus sp. UNC363MFTsu5.1]|nr:hypothetical protein [Rhodococcus sp. UNC363MFTsu5.1]